MKYTKNILLKNNKASYKDETFFDTAFEKQFLTDRETAAREVYLCAIVDGHIVGTGLTDK